MSKRGKLGVFGAAVAAVGWVRWRPFAVAVEGDSMRPVLEPGDWLLAVTRAQPRRGSLVVVAHPLRPGVEMVKRIEHLAGELVAGIVLDGGEYWLVGTNDAASTDSRSLGPFSRQLIRGVVVARYRPIRAARLFL